MKISMPVCPVAFFRDSNDQSEPWNKPSKDFDIEACGRNGRATIKASVHGYWSSDVMTMYVERHCDWRENATPSWDVSLSHSSGGRLTTEDSKNYPSPYYMPLKSDLDAEECFGMALIAMAQFGREVKKHAEALETFYQQRRAELKAKEEAEREAQLARIAADEPLGEIKASKLLSQVTNDLGMYSERKIAVYQRGADYCVTLNISRKQNTTFRFMGDVISRKKAIEELASASNRSHIEV
jgi:hypothetical protein